MSDCAPIETQTKVRVQLSDGGEPLVGVFLAHEDWAGQDFLVIDTGGAEPTRINAGYVVWVQAQPPAPSVPLPKERKRGIKAAPPQG